ncbi:hypothetical protein U1Q18_049096 [Sarracenia purpurea var. burkii]
MITIDAALNKVDFSINPVLTWYNDDGKKYIITTTDPIAAVQENEAIVKKKAAPFPWKVMEIEGNFNFNPTKCFLAEYTPLIRLYEEGKISKAKIWQDMSAKFAEKSIIIDEKQLKNKLKSLTRAFQDVKKNNNKTGRARKKF